jgi:thiamine biosynthesis protein ThiI
VDAKAIVTGENLAQVASQTLVNLRATDQAAELPILRPVLGADKVEVVRLAKRIGSYESSCMPARSGCAPKRGCWARPTKPSTRAQLEKILEIERTIDIDGLLERSLKSLRQIDELL